MVANFNVLDNLCGVGAQRSYHIRVNLLVMSYLSFAQQNARWPRKTIWGKEQMAWFKKSFADSDATFRLLISPTPVVEPDRKSKPVQAAGMPER